MPSTIRCSPSGSSSAVGVNSRSAVASSGVIAVIARLDGGLGDAVVLGEFLLHMISPQIGERDYRGFRQTQNRRPRARILAIRFSRMHECA